MNNFNTTLAATETALNSAGSAAKENAAWMESLAAQTNNLKATFQDLANNVIDSELVSSILTLANEALSLLNSDIGTTITQWGLLTGVLVGGLTIWGSVLKSLLSFPAAFASIGAAVKGAGVAAGLASVSFGTLMSTIFPIAAVIGLVVVALYKLNQALKPKTVEDYTSELADLNSELEANKTRLEELNKIPYKDRTTEIQAEIDKLEELNKALETNIKQKEKDISTASANEMGSGLQRKKISYNLYNETGLLKVYSGKNINEAIDNLKKIGKLSQDFETDTANVEQALKDVNEALGETGNVLSTSENGYYSVDQSIQILIEEYDALKLSLDGWIGKSEEERKSLTDNKIQFIQNYEALSDYAKQLKNSGIAITDLSKKQQDLIKWVDENEASYKNLTSQMYLANDSLALLGQGYGLNQTAIERLLEVYPQLEGYIENVNGLNYLQVDSLKAAAIGGDEYAGKMINVYKSVMTAAKEAAIVQAKLANQNLLAVSSSAPEYEELKKNWLDSINNVKEINAAIDRLNAPLTSTSGGITPTNDYDIGGSGGKKGGSGGKKGKTDKTDPLEEEYKKYQELNKATEHYLFLQEKNGASKEKLIELNKGFQEILNNQANTLRDMGADENSEYIRELQNAWWGLQDTIEGIENDITQELRDAFDERLNISENYISDRNSLDDWGSDNEVAAWKRVGAWMDEMYAQGLIDYEYYIQKRNNITKKEAQAEKKAWEEANKAAVQSLSKEVDEWEIAFSYVADKAQDEIDALQKERDSVEEFWDSQIDALKEINDELDKQLERQQLLDDLARAKQKKVMVYKDGRFQYIQDADAVSEAQANLDKYDRDAALQEEVKNLEQSKKEALKSIDDQIEAWEEYRDEWKNVVSDYQKQQDKLIAEQKLGTKLEGENWRNRLDKLADYVNEYKALMQDLANAQNAEYGQTTPTGQPNADRLAQINAQMAANSAAWHNASDAEKKRLEEANKQLAAEKDSIQGTHSTLNPDTGKWETSGGGGSSSGGGKVGSTDSQGHVITGTDGTWGANNPNAPSSSGSGGKGVIGKNPAIYGRASGTLGDSGGIRLVGEKGPELRVLSKGDGVLPADVTRNLWSWGETTPSDVMASLQGMGTATEGITQPIIVENLNLPNVHDGPEFADYMRNNFMRDAVQKAHMR